MTTPLFEQVLMQCAATPELVAEFDRLHKTNLQRKGAPINLAIDDATGKTNDDMRKFVEFVAEVIFPTWLAAMEADVQPWPTAASPSTKSRCAASVGMPVDKRR